MMSPEDRRRTAYHEGGHAIVGMLTEGADPVRKVSIIPRGMALGVTFAAPGERPLQLPRARGAREDQRRARRPRRGGDRVRRDEHGRRVGHPAADRDRPPDGRPLGHEPGDRAGGRHAARRRGAVPARRRRGLAPTRSGSSTRRCAASSKSPHEQVLSLLRENRASSTRSRTRCSSTRRWTRTTPTRPPASRMPSRRRGAIRDGGSVAGELTRTGQAPARRPRRRFGHGLRQFHRAARPLQAPPRPEARSCHRRGRDRPARRGKPGYGEARGPAKGSARRAPAHRAPARPRLKRRRRPLWTMTPTNPAETLGSCPGSGQWTLTSSRRSSRSTSLPT